MYKFEKPIYVTKPILPDLPSFTKSLEKIWESRIFSNQGFFHNCLEEKIKKTLKVEYVSLFNNGTNALIAAIKALDLKGEVITTPFTFAATPHSLSMLGIKPVFCDIDPKTYTIDPKKIEKLINKNTSAILAVHVFGIPCYVEEISKIAKKYRLKVIYDAAHAFQTEINGKGIGSFGDITMFSFHPTKLFHTSEGGCLTYSEPKLKTKIDLIKNFGIKNEEEVVEIGFNGKMDEIKAALGLECLKILPKERDQRKEVLETYMDSLRDVSGLSFFEFPDNIQKSFQYFAIEINDSDFGKSRDEVYECLKTYNVFSRKYFYPLCSSYDCYTNISLPEEIPISKKIGNNMLCLPFYSDLSKESVLNICEIIKSLRRLHEY